MKNKSFQISIPEPCDQNFNEMTPAEGGRHCAQCDKVLVDFSVLTDKEIVDVLKKNKGNLCGNFRKSQLDRNISLVPHRINSTRSKAASLLLTSMLGGGMLEAQNQLLFPQTIEQQETHIRGNTMIDDFIEKEKDEKITFSGTVVEESGEALIGASILIKGTSTGTTADIDGNFKLQIPKNSFQPNPILEISYTGYTTVEIEVSNKNTNLKEPYIITLSDAYLIGEIIGIVITTPSDDLYYPAYIPHWERQGKWLRDIKKGIKNLAEKFRAKRKEKKAKKAKVKKEFWKAEQKYPIINNNTITPPTEIHFTKITNISPNPFLSEINIDFSSEKNNELEITVSDINGRVIHFSNENVLLGNNKIKINIDESLLHNGTYYLRIKDIDGYIQTRTLVRIQQD